MGLLDTFSPQQKLDAVLALARDEKMLTELARELERALGRKTLELQILGEASRRLGMRERARIGRVLTAWRPSWPKTLEARLLGISRQALTLARPSSPSSPRPGAAGPQPPRRSS